jgi:cytoskeletal protein RodZ
VAKRTPENNRRRIIEEQRKKARAQERRKTVLTIVISTIVGIALVGSAVYFGIKDKDKTSNTPLKSVALAKDAAGCLDPKEEKVPDEATQDAVKHTTETVQYATIPPTSGRHDPSPLPVGAKKLYTRTDNPRPERAVHNLEHAYVVVWYDKKVTEEQLDRLKEAADAAEGKFLIVPWDRADFPDDKHIVLTAWGEKQECSDVSGAVMQEFMDKFGGFAGKAPEKAAG